MVHGDDPKHAAAQPPAPKPTEAPVKPAKKEAPSFAKILSEVDPESLADELEALQAAYDAIPHLPAPKDPKHAANVVALKEKIRTTVGKAHGGVKQAIENLASLKPLLEKLGAEVEALNKRNEKDETK